MKKKKKIGCGGLMLASVPLIGLIPLVIGILIFAFLSDKKNKSQPAEQVADANPDAEK